MSHSRGRKRTPRDISVASVETIELERDDETGALRMIVGPEPLSADAVTRGWGRVEVIVECRTATGTAPGRLACDIHPDGSSIYVMSPDGANSLILRLSTAKALLDLLPKAIIMAEVVGRGG
jgi:hypothetical protein